LHGTEMLVSGPTYRLNGTDILVSGPTYRLHAWYRKMLVHKRMVVSSVAIRYVLVL
jgi:hypothetical protein